MKQGEWLSIVWSQWQRENRLLARLIDGLWRSESGDIIISGDNWSVDTFGKNVAKSAWSFKILITSLLEQSVEDDVAWSENHGLSHDGKRVHEALELVGMQNFLAENLLDFLADRKSCYCCVVALQPDIIILMKQLVCWTQKDDWNWIRPVKEIKDKQII